jgi:hypothetical protein
VVCVISEMHRTLGLVLHHNGTCRHQVAVTYVPDLERDEIAAAQLAVDAQVEQRKFSHPALHLETNAQSPDVPELEGCLLPDDLALVPRLARRGVACGTHDGLPSS